MIGLGLKGRAVIAQGAALGKTRGDSVRVLGGELKRALSGLMAHWRLLPTTRPL